jgi:type II pantothenate kinase
VVYFTRSPEPPSSPSVAATRGSSSCSDISTPSESASPTDDRDPSPIPTPAAIKRNGALTPSILDSQTNVVAQGLSGLHDGLLRDTIRRRAAHHFPGGSLNFERFETDNIDECVEFIRSLIERSATANGVSIEEMRKGVKIMATGGGAHKFYELFSGILGVDVLKEDEMECLIEGLKFITVIPDEVYYFSDELIQSVSHPSSSTIKANSIIPTVGTKEELARPSPDPPKYAVTFEGDPVPQLPCLLVNIGSGVSIIKVDEDGQFERVSGTSLGGGTLWGLLSLLTPATSFDGERPC